jgi:hypothetical protein
MRIVKVFATTSFSYVGDAAGGLQIAEKGYVSDCPEPVATYAVDSEAALLLDTPEGQAAYHADQEARRKPGYRDSRTALSRPVCWPLGDVMGLLKAAG